jgi:hypothetical protein
MQKSQPSFPNLKQLKIPFIIKQVAKDGNCLFRSFLAAQGIDNSNQLMITIMMR